MEKEIDQGWITNNPEMSNARIFVSNLPKMPTTSLRETLIERFSTYGSVNGVTVFHNYGFVQFDTEESAKQALESEQGKDLAGNCLIIKTAKTKKPEAAPRAQNVAAGARGSGARMPRPSHGDSGRPQRSNSRAPPGRPSRGGRPDRSERPDRMERGPRMPYHHVHDEQPWGGSRKRYRDSRDDYPRRRSPSPYGRGRPGPMPLMRSQSPKSNSDCELVVLDKKSISYAEHIEGRLKCLGLAVDMLFPRPSAPLNHVLDEICSRGVIYAIVIQLTNEEHRSISLNILHTEPAQEHRNMPLEDAMNLVAKNFEEYIDANCAKFTPAGVCHKLECIRDNITLSTYEYNFLIRFIEKKRDLSIKPEAPMYTNDDGVEAMKTVAAANQHHSELQQKIISMMETYKPSQQNAGALAAAPGTGSVAPVPAPPATPSLMPHVPPAVGAAAAVNSSWTDGSAVHGQMPAPDHWMPQDNSLPVMPPQPMSAGGVQAPGVRQPPVSNVAMPPVMHAPVNTPANYMQSGAYMAAKNFV